MGRYMTVKRFAWLIWLTSNNYDVVILQYIPCLFMSDLLRRIQNLSYMSMIWAQNGWNISLISHNIKNRLDKCFVLIPSLDVCITTIHLFAVQWLDWPPNRFLAVELRWITGLKYEFETALGCQTCVGLLVRGMIVHYHVDLTLWVRISQVIGEVE